MDPFLDRDVLPTTVVPRHYSLHFRPGLDHFKFTGHLSVQLDVKESTSKLICHANELEIHSAQVTTKKGGIPVKAKSITLVEKEEQVVFEFESVFEKGQSLELEVEFTGHHNDRLVGFYRSTYQDEKTKETKYIYVTQFEATDARRAFPCWDEPALKATFDITLTVASHLVALSNMDAVSTQPSDEGKVTVTFARSPIMSTYLLACVVGELDMIETHTQDKQKVLVRVFAPKGQVEQGRFALEVAHKTLTYFTDYFATEYPLPKMDLVAIPDFGAGAMENWGLVTYRTIYLLLDEVNSSIKAKQNVAYVVGHELAHQWFGNLVTMEWWADLWLNEGFATWVGWLAVDHLFPSWNIWTQFVNNDYQRALTLDALLTSHPIEVPVKNPSEIHQIFDAISYSKGASVIRMLNDYLTESVFRDGIRAYLKQFKYSNAKTMDLWRALEKASGKPVAQLMHTWTRKDGFPVITVKEKVTGNDLTFQLSQQRFLSSTATHEIDTKWFVPLQVVTSETYGRPSADVMTEATQTIQVGSKALLTDGFVKLNYLHTGVYRVAYSDALLQNIGKAVASKTLKESDRIGVLTDVFALAQAGVKSLTSALNLLQFYQSEMDYVVCNEIVSQLDHIASIWWEEDEVCREKLRLLNRKLFSRLSGQLGWEYDSNEKPLTSLLRTLVLATAGKNGDPAILKEARTRFDKFVAGDKSAIHPNLRGSVLSLVLKQGTEKDYESVLKIYRETTIIDQKLSTLGALGSVEDPKLIQRNLELALSADVRPQDIIYVIGSVAANPKGRRSAWEFTKTHWQVLYDRYYNGSTALLARIITSTTEKFTSEKMYKEVESFFGAKDLKSLDRSIKQSLEKIDSNCKWLARDRDAVNTWLLNMQ